MTIDYRRAFKIACELLNGSVLYGVDADRIYAIMMAKDGVVSSNSYESYILNNLQELDRGQYESESTTKNNLGVDCISKTETLKAMDTYDKYGYTARYGLERLDKDDKGFVPYVKYEDMVNCVKGMPPVTPQVPRCKECKWWKDKDGVFRRGVGAKSKCPINNREVYLGNEYCYMFEPQERNNQ